jgi:DNA adenine methylase
VRAEVRGSDEEINQKEESSMTETLTPPLKWHGGKSYLASKIIALMPPHLHYVEPFFGGGSVMLAKDPEGVSEVANDLNRELSNFWNVLRSPTEFGMLHRFLEATPFSEEMWRGCEDQGAGTPIDRAFRFFVRCRQSLAGRMDSFAPLSRTRVRRGMNEQASAWINAVDGLPAVHARLRRVVVLNRKAVDVIRQQDGEQTLFYLDPPYLHETRASTGEYAHEMTADDHGELLTVLASIKGKFLLSGYDSELYRTVETLRGWQRRVFDLPNNSAGGETKRRMQEIVWMNYEPAA